MTGHVGLFEKKLHDLTKRYIERHGYGSTTKLAKEIHRTKTWVSLFVNGERRLGIDDGIAIARALGVDWIALVRETTTSTTRAEKKQQEPLGRPLDRRELQMLRLFVAADEEGRQLLLTVGRTITAKSRRGRSARSVRDDASEMNEQRRA